MYKAHTAFKFKHFNLLHGDGVWKAGTDSVLLGSWSDLQDSKRLLDLGTGSGILALMLAQRYEDLTIEAAEIVPQALDVAAENVRCSEWANRINIRSQDLTEINHAWLGGFDAIVCNPPYFPTGVSSPIESRRSSRQGIGFSLWDVPLLAHQYLKTSGCLSIVIPSSVGYMFIEKANVQRLFVRRRLNVRHRDTAPVSTLLLDLTHKRLKTTQESLTLYNRYNKPTADYSVLCKDFLSL